MELPASDFDGAWKYALDHYLRACLTLFFPQVESGIDWTQPISDHPTALQQINPETTTGKQHVDKLVQVVRRDGEPALVFVHLEIQAQRDARFAERIYRYHSRLFDRDGRPVASLAILADDDPAWHPTAFGYDLWGTNLTLAFPTVKLLAVDRTLLEASANPIATLSLIHRDAQETRGQPDERMRRKLARFRSFFRKGYTVDDMRRLLRILDQILRLDAERQVDVHATMREIEREETNMDTLLSDIEQLAFAEGEAKGIAKGIAEGIAEGEVKGHRDLLLRQLTRRFGTVPVDLQARLDALTPEALLALGEALFDLASLAELEAWLGAH